MRDASRRNSKDNDPIRANVEFFIGLRNQIEHRFEDYVLAITAPEAHACIINFEAELTRRFGSSGVPWI